MEFASKKYIILLVIICSVFALFIIKAFDYLPDKSVETVNPMVNTQQQYINQTNNNQINQTQPENDYDQERHKSGHIDFMPKVDKESSHSNDYEEIKAPRGTFEEDVNPSGINQTSNLSPDELAIKTFISGVKYINNNDYSNALSELQNIPNITNDKELIAMSYEKIAEMYAIQRRYGTALSFAGKAYNISPNTNREMLIARIYYQSGDTQNAMSRLNNILSQGFNN